jgi:flagellar protein FlgJ
MLPTADAASVYTDFAGFIALRGKAQQDPNAALPAVAREFEGLFLQMMLKSMRETTGADPLLGEEGGMYTDLFDQQIALELARAKPIGLAEMLARAIGSDLALATPAGRPEETGPAFPFIPLARPLVEAIESRSTASLEAGASSASERRATFVASMWPHAQSAAASLGVDPRLLVAQAALETGWGRYLMSHPDGRSANNLFGIKADGRWEGRRVEVPTLEYENGALLRVVAPFRAYPSVAESFADYADFVRSNPRYAGALAHAADAGAYMRELQAAGYATDPAYAEKVLAILARPELRVPAVIASMW